MPTFVAITTRSRAPVFFNHFPTIVSDSPPELPGAHREDRAALRRELFQVRLERDGELTRLGLDRN